MSESSPIKFTIRAGDQERILFYLHESSNKDVILTLRSGEYFGDGPHAKNEILEQRYSIHRSTKSSNYNTIIQTLALRAGRGHITSHVTDAIKKHTGFAMIFSRRSPWLDTSHFQAVESEKGAIATLGIYEPDKFTLVYSVFIGARDREFLLQAPTDANIHQRTFGFIRVVILWSFLPLPSWAEGYIAHNQTFRPEITLDPDEQEKLRSMMTGCSESECLNSYQTMRSFLREGQIEVVSRGAGMEPRIVEAVTEYLRGGTSDSEEYFEYKKRMELALRRLASA